MGNRLQDTHGGAGRTGHPTTEVLRWNWEIWRNRGWILPMYDSGGKACGGLAVRKPEAAPAESKVHALKSLVLLTNVAHCPANGQEKAICKLSQPKIGRKA